MTGFLEGISDFFARHRAHCEVHEVYKSDCAACVAANQSAYVDSGTFVMMDAGDSSVFVDSSAADVTDTETTSADSSSTDSSSCDTSDFGGFDGGDSGGGGASGDF